MGKIKVDEVVVKSTYEIQVDNETIYANTKEEGERKYRSATKREGSICYFYRNDFNKKGKLIETYMIA